MDALPALEAEAKVRQGPARCQADELPNRPNLDDLVGRSDAIAAKLFGVSRGYVSEARRLTHARGRTGHCLSLLALQASPAPHAGRESYGEVW